MPEVSTARQRSSTCSAVVVGILADRQAEARPDQPQVGQLALDGTRQLTRCSLAFLRQRTSVRAELSPHLLLARVQLGSALGAVLDLLQRLARSDRVHQYFGHGLAILALQVANQKQPLGRPLECLRVSLDRVNVVAQNARAVLGLDQRRVEGLALARQRGIDLAAVRARRHGLAKQFHGARLFGGRPLVAHERGIGCLRRLPQAFDVLQPRTLRLQLGFFVVAQLG